MEKKPSTALLLILLAFGCFLAVEAGYLGVKHLLRDSAEAWRQHAPTGAINQGRSDGTKTGYQIIIARNLFGVSPQTAPGANSVTGVGGPSASASLGLVLMGTIDDPLGASRAIFLDKKSGRQQLYRLGDKVQGASLEEIGRGRAILVAGGRREVFDLSEAAAYRAASTSGANSTVPPLEIDEVVASPRPEETQAESTEKQQGSGEGKGRRSFRLQRAPQSAGAP
jgi:Type II secretion system protein C